MLADLRLLVQHGVGYILLLDWICLFRHVTEMYVKMNEPTPACGSKTV